MCIIVAKEKGIEIPSKETLQTCFENNPDGAGFMYVKDDKVVIDKGYMDFRSFYKRLKKLDRKLHLKDKALVMHFRIGTHGKNDRQTTHPFPISSNASDLKRTYITTDLGVVHNGIIQKYDYENDLSDTQLFIRDVISILKGLNRNFYKDKGTLDMLNRVTKSKLCFLDTKNDLIYVGDFVKDDNGVRYSNSTYKYSYYNDWKDWRDYDYKDYKYTPAKTNSTESTTLSDYEEKWEDGYYYEDDYNGETIDEFMERNNYTKLYEGDIVQLKTNDVWVVESDGTYYITDKGNVFEYYDGYLSLIETGCRLLSSWEDYTYMGA